MGSHCPGCALDPGACVQHPGDRYAPAAADLAREMLADLPDRCAHSLGVGRRARQLALLTDSSPAWVDWVSAAALVHDIGYGSPRSGMHARDGAEVLDERGDDLAELAPLVAWHSTAPWEYAARGMSDPPWVRPVGLDAALLWVADFTTTPAGEPTTLEARVAEIRSRYPEGSPVIEALDASADEMATAVGLVERATGTDLSSVTDTSHRNHLRHKEIA